MGRFSFFSRSSSGLKDKFNVRFGGDADDDFVDDHEKDGMAR